MTPRKPRVFDDSPVDSGPDPNLFRCIPGDSTTRRVWCYLARYTKGFQTPVALLKPYKSKPVLLTQADLAEKLSMSPKNVHRSILELEQEGWLKREAVIGGKGLTKGNVRLRFAPDPTDPSNA